MSSPLDRRFCMGAKTTSLVNLLRQHRGEWVPTLTIRELLFPASKHWTSLVRWHALVARRNGFPVLGNRKHGYRLKLPSEASPPLLKAR